MNKILFVFLAFLIASCTPSNQNIADDSTTDTYDLATTSGLRYTMLQTGNGPKVESGRQIKTHCILTLTDGTLIWSSRDDGQEYIFVQGVTSHVAGFEEALTLMKEGDRIKVHIPSHLGYGAAGRPPIPPNADLIFDIEVLEVEARADL